MADQRAPDIYPSPQVYTDWQSWGEDLQRRLETAPDDPIPVLYVPSFSVVALPNPTVAGGIIFVLDETGGAVLAFSDGTNWLRVTDRAIVS